MDQNIDSSSANWLDRLIIDAVGKRASDIHFEPARDGLIVRIRVDGLLHELNKIDPTSQENILSRIKVLSKMNITEHRIPQDGHYEFDISGKLYNFRTSTIPTSYGETIVFRVLNREDVIINLENLGLLPTQLSVLQKMLISPSGMLLTTGPTGSGKTSLLYAIINAINTPEKSTITLEDPVEYEIDGIQQVQINDSVGLTFTKAIRSVLRQDPDFLMIGEIRDGETALMAVQAALTGISVLSTFHTFDVPSLITRFAEMGITNSVIAQAIKGIISTRLVRKICPNCKVSYQLEDFEKKYWGNRQMPQQFMQGRGCDSCLGTGFKGRTGIFEVVELDQDVRAGIIERKSASDMYQLLREKQNISLKDAAFEKVALGETTIPEVIRVLGIS